MRREYITKSPEETREFGRQMAEAAKPGDVIALIGDLGVGKTVFTKGIAEGLEITEPVSSPTFTILQVYEKGEFHFIILTCTASVMWRRWKKSVMRTVFMGKAYVLLNGPT